MPIIVGSKGSHEITERLRLSGHKKLRNSETEKVYGKMVEFYTEKSFDAISSIFLFLFQVGMSISGLLLLVDREDKFYVKVR